MAAPKGGQLEHAENRQALFRHLVFSQVGVLGR